MPFSRRGDGSPVILPQDNWRLLARLKPRPGYHEYERITVEDLMANLSLRVELET